VVCNISSASLWIAVDVNTLSDCVLTKFLATFFSCSEAYCLRESHFVIDLSDDVCLCCYEGALVQPSGMRSTLSVATSLDLPLALAVTNPERVKSMCVCLMDQSGRDHPRDMNDSENQPNYRTFLRYCVVNKSHG
jgi:hypothetical protein